MSTADPTHSFEEHRTALTGIAYRMLGTLAEAEDMVQETYLRWHAAEREAIRSPRAWLTTTVTRLCIDQLRSARVQREEYKGPWLPEPLVHDGPDEPLERLATVDSISMAFLRLLEQLSPNERAAFLLHRVFDYKYKEIASILGKSEAGCRQLVHRAKRRLDAEKPRFDATQEERERLATSFSKAVQTGEMAPILSVLAEDVTLWSDGGGRALAALNPIYGASKVARFFLGILSKAPEDSYFEPRHINGEPGFVGFSGGQAVTTMTFEVAEGRIVGIHMVRNPEKLSRIVTGDSPLLGSPVR